MAGKAKRIIEKIIAQKSGGNTAIKTAMETKLILKGFNPTKFDVSTPDDPLVIDKLKSLANELGVQI